MRFERVRDVMRAPWLSAAASGLLLYFIQPNWPLGFLAWGALVFLIRAATQAQDVSHAFRLGCLSGLFFFLPGLSWLQHVAFVGWLFGAFVQALFIGLFASLVFLGRQLEAGAYKLVWFAGSWLLCEWFRTELPVLGFGWHFLAYSQGFYPVMVQSANIVGAYGLGFFIALSNAGLVLAWELYALPQQKKRSFFFGTLWLGIPLLLMVYGHICLSQPAGRGEQLRIGLVQSNIPEKIKWRPEAKEQILEIHEKLTQLTAFDSPDLTVWPEASFPGYFNRDAESMQIRELAKTLKTPILVGSPHFERDGIYYNSAYLVRDTEGDEKRYDKMRLVPFGEYVPFKFMLGWLRPLADAYGVGDFSAGKQYTLFRLYEDVTFGVLICFEDIFPRLAQEFVKRGAHFLVVITNDSWFGRTAAPYQHLTASIFRAVENGVPVVRAANTGVSALISARGEVTHRVSSEDGQNLFITGHETGTILLTYQKTGYQKNGYLFPLMILMVMLNLSILLWLKKRVARIRPV